MGEPLPQRLEIHFSDATVQALREFFAAGRRVGVQDAPPDQPAITPELLAEAGIEPWTFRDPRQGCDVTVYVDDRNQVRRVPATRRGEVPPGWRRVLLA